MSQLIVPGGRPAPKKEEPTGPVVLSWAEIVTVSDTGMVFITPYDSDFLSLNCQRKATPEDVIGACAYIESQGPRHIDSIPDLSEVKDIFKTVFLLGMLPDGHPVIHDDIYQPIIPTYTASSQQVFMAAAVIRTRVAATMTAELTAPGAGQAAAQVVWQTLQQFEVERAIRG